MKPAALSSFVALFFLSASVVAKEPAKGWRNYAIPGHGSLSIAVPDPWEEEVRQAGAKLPPTIVLKKGDLFELLLTPLPSPEGKAPTLEDLEAGLRKAGSQHLPSARQETLILEKIEGEQAVGRYFLLTEKDPRPGEYPSVISGSLLTGPLVVSFTLLLRDSQAEYVQQALKALASARSRKGQGGKYAGTLEDMHIKVLMAHAAGLQPEVLEDTRKSYQVRFNTPKGPVLLVAKAIRGGIDLWIEGPDYLGIDELLQGMTVGFEAIR